MEERPFSDISYQQFLDEGKIMGSRCQKCHTLYTPPRPICVKCGGTAMQWAQMKGKGQLAAFTCIAVAPPFMQLEGYDRNHPYVLGVVKLDEGVKVDARIEGVDGSKPDTIKVGARLTARFIHRGEGENTRTFLAFEPY